MNLRDITRRNFGFISAPSTQSSFGQKFLSHQGFLFNRYIKKSSVDFMDQITEQLTKSSNFQHGFAVLANWAVCAIWEDFFNCSKVCRYFTFEGKKIYSDFLYILSVSSV